MSETQYEVRLYFNGRPDWDTEFYTATCNTESRNKAEKIAKQRHADHWSCGLSTPEAEYKYSGLVRIPKVRAVGQNPKDQVKAIEGFLGMASSEEEYL